MPKKPPGTATSPLLLTAEAVATMLSVSREQVYRMCTAGHLRSIVLGGNEGGRRRRIYADSVAEYVAKQPTDAA